ncbi:hypothetical protein ISN75_01910 [Dyella marensis]|uniref:hypothetical protein n=1 Tax=Dyella marensis TaxID=500610 RepID=UPI0031D692CF
MAIDFASQADLVRQLSSIIPEFASEWAEWRDGESPLSSNPHVVYMALMPLLGRVELSDKQCKALAELINGAVAAGGMAENAVFTCFLEHFRNVPVHKRVKPYLRNDAKLRLSANFTP